VSASIFPTTVATRADISEEPCRAGAKFSKCAVRDGGSRSAESTVSPQVPETPACRCRAIGDGDRLEITVLMDAHAHAGLGRGGASLFLARTQSVATSRLTTLPRCIKSMALTI
jgi:hypothetical protein